MKKLLLIAALAAASFTNMANAGTATANLTVAFNILPTCGYKQNSYSMTWPSGDLPSITSLTQCVTVNFQCDTNAAATIFADSAANIAAKWTHVGADGGKQMQVSGTHGGNAYIEFYKPDQTTPFDWANGYSATGTGAEDTFQICGKVYAPAGVSGNVSENTVLTLNWN